MKPGSYLSAVVAPPQPAQPHLTMQQLLGLKNGPYQRPEGLIRIVLSGGTTGEVRLSNQHRKRVTRSTGRRGGGSKRGGRQWGRGGGGGGGGAALEHSANSFSAARKRFHDQPQTQKLIGEIRGLLNRVTSDNFEAIRQEFHNAGVVEYAANLDDDDLEVFLMEIAKLIVNKSKIDHEFGGLYAAVAKDMSTNIDIFGDVLYEVCREAIPKVRYDPDRKTGYLGALLLLVEMRRCNLVSSGGIESFVDRLLAAIERCNPDTVFSVQNEEDNEHPIDAAQQIEVCIELICKFLPAFLAIEWPDWTQRYLDQLRDLQSQKNRIKPRPRFMLMDFFQALEKLRQ